MRKLFTRFVFAAVALSLFAVNVRADEIGSLKERQEQNRRQSRSARGFLEDAQNRMSGVLLEIAELDAELDDALAALETTESELTDANARLEAAYSDLAGAKLSRETQYETMKERMRYIYENSPSGYLRALAGAKSFADFINRVEYIGVILEYDKSLFKRLSDTEAQITALAASIEYDVAAIELMKSRQETDRARLESAIADKNALAAAISSDESAYSVQIADLERENDEIAALITEAERAAREKAEKERLERERAERERLEREAAKKAAAAQTAPKVTYTGGALGWPVGGYYDISSGYVNRISPITGKREFHTGIDIPAPSGTSIAAAAAGTVIMSKYNGGYGYCVIIDHGGGLSTLYGHNSKLLVDVGDYVAKGQIIAKCGSTGYSTGPHCHFEVRLDGGHTNPLPYLKD